MKDSRKTHLPTDLISEILVRVPQKESLLRFRTVCKTWLNLISKPKFTHSHLLTNPPQPHIIVSTFNQITLENDNYNLAHSSISLMDDSQQVTEFTFPVPISDIFVQASSNGLLLLHDGEHNLYISNPFTRQSMKLSFPHAIDKAMNYLWSLVHDVCTECYKVVAVPVIPYADYRCFVLTVRYTHKESDWRELITPNVGVSVESQRIVLVDNKLHWLIGNRQKETYIQTLSVVEEEFGKIDCPTDVRGCPYYILVEISGSLNMVDIIFESEQLNIWVLEDRVKSLWLRTCSINLTSIACKFFPSSVFTAGSSTEMLIRYRNQLFMYDTNNGESRLVFSGDSRSSIISAFAHVNSIVSWE